MEEEKEEWRAVVGHEGLYEVSSFGNVKGLDRLKWSGKSYFVFKGKMLKQTLDNHGYYQVRLFKNTIGKTNKVHLLVAESFLGHTRCGFKLVVNHIDFNKRNNNVNNLEIVTTRRNINHGHKFRNESSLHSGVYMSVRNSKWCAQIRYMGVRHTIGLYENEEDAAIAYSIAMIDVENNCYVHKYKYESNRNKAELRKSQQSLKNV